MDLHRVVTAVGNINNNLPLDSVSEFIKHALLDFNKITLSELETELFKELKVLETEIPENNNPHERLRWSEKILTLRCRL